MSWNSPKSPMSKLSLYVSAFLWISPIVALTACSHEDKTQYAPLTYDYLTPIFFNVSQITIQDQSASREYPRDISNLSPTPPVDALKNMANNRLKARGTSGSAVFTIQRASLQESDDDAVYGQIDVTLDIYNKNHKKMGSIQVSTNHTYETDHHKGDLNSRANLYDITQKMMQELNVELEYQIRNHLEAWIVDATGTPISDSIKTQDLNGTASTNNDKPQPTAPSPKKAPVKEDMSAVFPDGISDDSTAPQTKTAHSPASSPKSKHPVGVLGTLPESSISKKY